MVASTLQGHTLHYTKITFLVLKHARGERHMLEEKDTVSANVMLTKCFLEKNLHIFLNTARKGTLIMGLIICVIRFLGGVAKPEE